MSKRGQTPRLYFIRNTEMDIIKIGISTNVESRRTNLEFECGCRLEILTVVGGRAYAYEEALHAAFDGQRKIGEWFNPSAGLLDLIAAPETILAFLKANAEPIRAVLLRQADARSNQCRERATEQAERRWAAIGAELDERFPLTPRDNPRSERTESGEIEAAGTGVTRAGLEPATYGLKGPQSNAGETPTDAEISGSTRASSDDARRSAPENGSKSPDKSPEASTFIAGWGANSRLREIHVNDGLTVRLNDTQLEARSPGGTWQPLTLSLIPRPFRTALADLLARPIEQDHTPKCRIRTGGPCTCPAGVRA